MNGGLRVPKNTMTGQKRAMTADMAHKSKQEQAKLVNNSIYVMSEH